jgi:hypothetical protein
MVIPKLLAILHAIVMASMDHSVLFMWLPFTNSFHQVSTLLFSFFFQGYANQIFIEWNSSSFFNSKQNMVTQWSQDFLVFACMAHLKVYIFE